MLGSVAAIGTRALASNKFNTIRRAKNEAIFTLANPNGPPPGAYRLAQKNTRERENRKSRPKKRENEFIIYLISLCFKCFRFSRVLQMLISAPELPEPWSGLEPWPEAAKPLVPALSDGEKVKFLFGKKFRR